MGVAPFSAARADADLSQYEKIVKDAEAPVVWAGPTEKAAAPKDKFLVIISCNPVFEGCRVEVESATAVAKRIGWRSKAISVTDPSGYDQAMRTGINAGADAIILDGVDQAFVPGGIAVAKSKKIPVVSVFQGNVAGEHGVDADVSPDGKAEGRILAASAIVNDKGKVHALMINDAEFTLPAIVLQAFKSELATCTQCEISYANPINFTASIVGTTLPQQVVGAVRSDPKINAMAIGFDVPAIFIVPALDAAGFRDKVKMYSQLGNRAPVAFVRDGNVLVSDMGASIDWGIWGGMDEIIRVMDGQPTVDENVPVQLLSHDQPQNLPEPDKLYDAVAAGFHDKYLELWGVK